VCSFLFRGYQFGFIRQGTVSFLLVLALLFPY
jgi:hypothetical protein